MNIAKICDFIKNHSISLGVFIVYEYNRIYLSEYIIRPDLPAHNLYIQKVKRFKKNAVNLARTNFIHQDDYQEYMNYLAKMNEKEKEKEDKMKKILLDVFKNEIEAKKQEKFLLLCKKNEEHYKYYKEYYDFYRNNKKINNK